MLTNVTEENTPCGKAWNVMFKIANAVFTAQTNTSGFKNTENNPQKYSDAYWDCVDDVAGQFLAQMDKNIPNFDECVKEMIARSYLTGIVKEDNFDKEYLALLFANKTLISPAYREDAMFEEMLETLEDVMFDIGCNL